MVCRAVDATTLTLTAAGLDDSQVVSGTPTTATAGLAHVDELEVGVWEHTAGTSTDVESDEVFVVLSGRATVIVEDGPTLELRPGVVGLLEAGARTTWVVHETVRKVYVLH